MGMSIEKRHRVEMTFRVISRDDFRLALSQLEQGEVWGPDEGPQDSDDAQNIDILVSHLDVLALHRGELVSWEDIGLERMGF